MSKISRRTALAITAAAPLALATRASAATLQVVIKDFQFNPPEMEVQPGDTIIFINQDVAPHTATHEGGAFDTGPIQPGEAAKVQLPGSDKFEYFCQFHPNMRGQLLGG